jgi:hypothetical protein
MNVSETRDAGLIQQRDLQRLSTAAEVGGELLSGQFLSEGIRPKSTDGAVDPQFIGRQRLEPAKPARIAKVDNLAPVEVEAGATIALHLVVRAADEFSSHSEVGQQAPIVLEAQKQVFPLAPSSQQLAPKLLEGSPVGTAKSP